MLTVSKKYVACLVIEWVLAVLAIAAFYMLVFQPQKDYRAGLHERLESLGESAELLTARHEQALSMEAAEARKILSNFVIMIEDGESLTFKAERLADGQSLASFSCKDTTDARSSANDALRTLRQERATISFASDFKTFARVLHAMESHKPVIFVDGFRVAADRTMAGPATITMELAALVEQPKAAR